jgi:hypothetical protein
MVWYGIKMGGVSGVYARERWWCCVRVGSVEK